MVYLPLPRGYIHADMLSDPKIAGQFRKKQLWSRHPNVFFFFFFFFFVVVFNNEDLNFPLLDHIFFKSLTCKNRYKRD